MNYFQKENCNPYGRMNADDCVIRALSHATGESWESIAKELFNTMLKTGYLLNTDKVYIPFIESRGFKPIKVPRIKGHGVPTVRDFANQHDSGIYILSLANHLVTVKNGFYIDTKDSGYKSIYKYWQKI